MTGGRGRSSDAPAGFVHVADGRLVDGLGRPLRWRGVGLGNWLLPEGYMWALWGGPQSPRAIEAMVADLVGQDRATLFWRRFREVFVTEADIAAIAAEGFDHVRLPINSRILVDDDGHRLPFGWALLDRLVAWCRTHGLTVVLDLHGAPGGQTGTEIDDSPHGRPELFTDDRYRALTVALWTMLAEHFRDEPAVAGYDLLNEPLPGEHRDRHAADLVQLYRDLTTAIRRVDPHHVIIYEGTHWATDVAIFTEVWDPNSMIEFHKYWSPSDRASIADFLAVRERLGLPLYMGEGGENNPAWLHRTFQLLTRHGIAWNLWPWKKLDTETSPYSVDPPERWPEVVAWAAGRGPRPSPDEAWATLQELLERMRLTHCRRRPDVINAVLGRAPLRIPAAGLTASGGAAAVELPEGIEPDHSYHRGDPGPPYEVRLGATGWVSYEVDLTADAVVEVTLEGLSAPGPLAIVLDDTPLASCGRQGWRSADPVTAGSHRIVVRSEGAAARFAAISIDLPGPSR